MSLRSDPVKTKFSTSSESGGSDAFIARLRTVLRHWPSADRLARATGVSPSAFRKWLRGDAEPSRERLVALAHAAGVSVGWLANGEGPAPRLTSSGAWPGRDGVAGSPAADFVMLPKRAEAAAAGPQSQTPPPAVEFLAIRHDWVRSVFGIEPEHLLLETAVGESMLPGIQDGDLLLVDATEPGFRTFGIYVLDVGGQRLVKRVQPKLDGGLTLISDNAAYEPEHIPASEAAGINAVGRVIWTCGPPRPRR